MAALPVDIRTELHELIDSIQNQAVLQAVYTLLTAQDKQQPYQLTAIEHAAVAEGLQQLDSGQGIPHAEVMADIRAKYAR